MRNFKRISTLCVVVIIACLSNALATDATPAPHNPLHKSLFADPTTSTKETTSSQIPALARASRHPTAGGGQKTQPYFIFNNSFDQDNPAFIKFLWQLTCQGCLTIPEFIAMTNTAVIISAKSQYDSPIDHTRFYVTTTDRALCALTKTDDFDNATQILATTLQASTDQAEFFVITSQDELDNFLAIAKLIEYFYFVPATKIDYDDGAIHPPAYDKPY